MSTTNVGFGARAPGTPWRRPPSGVGTASPGMGAFGAARPGRRRRGRAGSPPGGRGAGASGHMRTTVSGRSSRMMAATTARASGVFSSPPSGSPATRRAERPRSSAARAASSELSALPARAGLTAGQVQDAGTVTGVGRPDQVPPQISSASSGGRRWPGGRAASVIRTSSYSSPPGSMREARQAGKQAEEMPGDGRHDQRGHHSARLDGGGDGRNRADQPGRARAQEHAHNRAHHREGGGLEEELPEDLSRAARPAPCARRSPGSAR
jgi:hypothetical protein